MSSLLALGEGMVELKQDSTGQLIHKYAGDTLNTAIYAKRWMPEVDVYYFSAVGQDMFSRQMLDYLKSEQLNTQAMLTTDQANIGIYAIQTDDAGERSFTYWRKDSAATQMIKLLSAKGGAEALPDVGFVFFSGISLAILAEDDKAALLDLLAKLRQKGAKIAFDPNYRARMWQNQEHAKNWIVKAYQASDIVLPGLDEHQDLFGHQTVDDVKNFMQAQGVTEFVIKAGKDGVYGFNQTQDCHVPFNPAPTQVDTTAAGDSFAGTYMSSRVAGQSMLDAIKNADSVAREVVQHPGAIMNMDIYQTRFKTN
ncbi:sugar kinase [Catenovulum sp. 2E275]|uniref:sugar kinase n=1 Tax=Catenovulum sp. 2E275 TaxID=2980497 RepID=UPI0021CE1473|nr:sugar kinase [Catenovulum sp. 2E275]MCU4677037.1 sugar kinase [Catenovulum sp. 2E275]